MLSAGKEEVEQHLRDMHDDQRLIDYLFIVLRPAQEYFTYMETSPLPVKGCKIKPTLGAQGL
jgi:hypothetical protein